MDRIIIIALAVIGAYVLYRLYTSDDVPTEDNPEYFGDVEKADCEECKVASTEEGKGGCVSGMCSQLNRK